jgi:hypothetical protein
MASYVEPQLFDLYIRGEPYSNDAYYMRYWDYETILHNDIQQQGIVKQFVIEAHQKYPLKNYIAKYQTEEYTDYWDNPLFQADMDKIPAIELSRFKLRIWMTKIYTQEAQ